MFITNYGSVKSVKSVMLLRVSKKQKLDGGGDGLDNGNFSSVYTPKKFTDSTDLTDRSRPKRSLDTFLDYLYEWFLGPVKTSPDVVREFGLLIGDMCSEQCFRRDPMTFEGFRLLYWPHIRKRFYYSNVFMGIGYWEVPDQDPAVENMLYDRLVYDFDHEEDPGLAIKTAYEFSKLIRGEYDADAIIVRSGFKGAHVYIPLKHVVGWEHYQALWKHVLKLLPEDKRGLSDPNMLQWNRLVRIPMTVNYKNNKRSWAWVIQPRISGWSDFGWDLLQPLDTSKIEVYIFKGVELPQKINVVERPRHRVFDWVEKIVERGLPDGRKRFILYVLTSYLVNVLSLSDDEALERLKEFIDNSCKNFNNCGKVYDSWLKGDLRRVREKKLMPTSLNKIKEKDPELYSILEKTYYGDVK
ncbi:MAG: DNA primase noncatalytic subunit PriX [Thaumarchaeota archaeon]|nr:DNA primase noncatalytic subunit PriX [Candidatus Geocrenenecus arthurdayi]